MDNIINYNKLNKMSFRQRIIVLSIVLLAIYVLWKVLICNYTEAVQQRLELNQQELAQKNTQLRNKLHALQNDLQAQQLEVLYTQINAAKEVGKKLDKQMAEITEKLVSPAEMTKLLTSMLTDIKPLKVIKITNIPEEPLFPQNSSQQLYKHGMRLQLQGDLRDIRAFLQKVEGMAWQVLWHELNLTRIDDNTAIVTLIMHTLSLTGNWLGT